MTDHALLRRHGLFDAKVPRYTSYPPATRFAVPVGEENQAAWLAGVREGEEVSIYIHIPFCRRLCWFCACRTQGTQTLSPVASYVETLLTEVDAVRARLPDSVRMARLHLGGGTPTLLSPDLMDLLLSAVFDAFPKSDDFEFSVEIDPTEAAPGVIEALGRWGMTRASIGVQDFHEIVQKAIGRMQSFDETADAVRRLRKLDLHSLNFDLLYGLPFQTKERLAETIDQVLDLSPDRIALFGYAHVPKMSKRQVLIPESELPAPEARFELSSLAKGILEGAGYVTLGIDHYAKPEDSLARAMAERTMRRNFQGYTDDPCETLIGLGASAISQYREGYVQNAVATAAWKARVEETGLTGAKGYALTPEDVVIADMVQELMCYGTITRSTHRTTHLAEAECIDRTLSALQAAFPDCFDDHQDGLRVLDEALALMRIFAATVDAEEAHQNRYSLAV